MKNTESVLDKATWLWLRKGTLKNETEGTIIAAQDQALQTNAIRNKIDKQDMIPLCKMCEERDETISHVVAECKKLAQPQYKVWRHDRLAVVVHWNMCKRYKLPYKAQWYEHTPERVLQKMMM